MAIILMAVGGMFAAFGIGDLLGYFESDDGGPLVMVIFGGIFMIIGFFIIKSRIVIFDGKSQYASIQDNAAYHIFRHPKAPNKHSNSSNGSSTTFGIKMILENAEPIVISSYYSNARKRKILEIIDKLNDHLKKFKVVH